MGNTSNILVLKLERRKPLRGTRRLWEDNIKLDLKETGYDNVGLIHLSQDMDYWRAVVNTIMKLQIP
jgi:hypothetical protein